MSDEAQPSNGELLQAIVALHASTEAGLQRLDRKIDAVDAGLGAKIDWLEGTMNKRFDRVYDDLDELKTRVTLLEPHQA